MRFSHGVHWNPFSTSFDKPISVIIICALTGPPIGWQSFFSDWLVLMVSDCAVSFDDAIFVGSVHKFVEFEQKFIQH